MQMILQRCPGVVERTQRVSTVLRLAEVRDLIEAAKRVRSALELLHIPLMGNACELELAIAWAWELPYVC